MYRSNATRLTYASVSTKLLLVSVAVVLVGAFCGGLAYVFGQFAISRVFASAAGYILAAGLGLTLLAIALAWKMPDKYRISGIVRRGLFCPAYGNPLHLRDGQLLPGVRCKKEGPGVFSLTITAQGVTVEDISNASSAISSMLNRKYERYAITQTDTDVAYNYVRFRIEDVTIDLSTASPPTTSTATNSLSSSKEPILRTACRTSSES